jgi:uncharacterized protein YcbK (DUF882 family)
MKYFKIEELTHSLTAKARSIANVPTAEAEKNLEILVDCVLDRIREHWGGPIIVSSGYRCEALNEAVGGVKNSYHRLGMAADIYPQNRDLEALYGLIKSLFFDGVIGLSECYIDRKKRFIHVAYDNGGFNVWPFEN